MPSTSKHLTSHVTLGQTVLIPACASVTAVRIEGMCRKGGGVSFRTLAHGTWRLMIHADGTAYQAEVLVDEAREDLTLEAFSSSR